MWVNEQGHRQHHHHQQPVSGRDFLLSLDVCGWYALLDFLAASLPTNRYNNYTKMLVVVVVVVVVRKYYGLY